MAKHAAFFHCHVASRSNFFML